MSPVNPGFTHPGLEPEQPANGNGQPNTPEDKKLWAGKYVSEQELERGYVNLFSEGQRILERNKELEQRLAATAPREPANYDLSNDFGMSDRPNPADRSAARRDPREVLSEVGIPMEELDEEIDRRTSRAVQAALQPIFQGAQARSYVAQNYPDFERFEGEVAQFVEANPETKTRYQRLYQADPAGAMEWVYGQFSRSRQTPADATGGNQLGARMDALMPNMSGQGRQNPAEADFDEAYKQAFEHGQRTGDWNRLTQVKLGIRVPDSHYAGLGG